MLSPAQRTQEGANTQAEVLATTPREPATLLECAWRDYVYAEIWSRPGLDWRSRYLIAIATAVCAGAPAEVPEGYIRGALSRRELTLAELREAVLQLAVYAGWGPGVVMDEAVTRVADALGLAAETPPIQGEPWDPGERLEMGKGSFEEVMIFPAPPPVTPYFEAGIINFVFAEMWNRPGLDQRARRWVTLAGVASSACNTPIRTHTYAAMASGNATREEMQEFVLQYAIDGGWPRASVMQSVVFEMGERVAKGLPFE